MKRIILKGGPGHGYICDVGDYTIFIGYKLSLVNGSAEHPVYKQEFQNNQPIMEDNCYVFTHQEDLHLLQEREAPGGF